MRDGDLVAVAVLSGNRNFEGRISPDVRANYLASPPLVVAYALAGRVDIDLYEEPLGEAPDGTPIYLKDVWPTREEIERTVSQRGARRDVPDPVRRRLHRRPALARAADPGRRHLPLGLRPRPTCSVRRSSTGCRRDPPPLSDLHGARVLAVLGDSVTTDHISPAGSIKVDSPAGKYLIEHGVSPADFNSYGSRRGNHEVMMRGTFANVRLRNLLVPGVEGGFTRHLPGGEPMTIYDAAMRYRDQGVPLVLLAGKEYGTGSSRDWAAKGPLLLGVRAAIAESYERIHRSNLVGMGIAPLAVPERRVGQEPRSHRRGDLRRDRSGAGGRGPRARSAWSARRADGSVKEFDGRAPARHPAGGAVLPARRHPQLRLAPAQVVKCMVLTMQFPLVFSAPRTAQAISLKEKPRVAEGGDTGGGEGVGGDCRSIELRGRRNSRRPAAI